MMTLRAVSPNDRPPAKRAAKKPPKTVAQAVATGTLRDQFVAMRNRIAKAIDDDDIRAADLAALSRRLQELTKDIAALDAEAAAAEAEERDSAVAPDEQWSAV